MRDWACICILEEMRLCRIKETEWWVWWKPWRVEELKIDKAFSGGLFTIFWIRTRASLVGHIFLLLLSLWFQVSNFQPAQCYYMSSSISLFST